MKTVAVFGITGRVGRDVGRFLLSNGYYVIGVYLNRSPNAVRGLENITAVQINIAEEDMVKAFFQDFQPDYAINLAGYVIPAECEKHPEIAHRVNAQGAGNIAKHNKNGKTTYCSSYYVHRGTGDHRENDKVIPLGPDRTTLGVYGETKALGEFVTLEHGGNVARFDLVQNGLGPGDDELKRYSFSYDIFLKHKEYQSQKAIGKEMKFKVWRDSFNKPVDSKLSIPKALESTLRYNGEQRIFHIPGKTKISRADFAYLECRIFDFDPSFLEEVDMPNDGVARPRDGSLSSEITEKEIGYKPMPLEEQLLMLKTEFESLQPLKV